MTSPVIRAIAAMQAGHDPCRPGFPRRLDEPSGDAALIELGARWAKANAEYSDACKRLGLSMETARHPEPPEALFAQNGDTAFRFAKYAVVRADGRRWYCLGSLDERVSLALRKAQTREHRRPVRPEEELPADAHTVIENVPWPEAQARADGIVHAWDTWRSAIEAADIEAGVPAAEARVEHLLAVVGPLEDRIEVATAHTLAGVQVKARYAVSFADLDSQIPEELVIGILRELVALA